MEAEVKMKTASTLFLVAFAASAAAQMPADIAARVKEIGVAIDPPRTAAIYAPLHAPEPYAGVKVERDLKYGPDGRHLLDVFVPEAGTGPRPVLVFVHGGAFVGGNKRTGTSPFYDNIALAAARAGMVGVNMTYRLAPKFQWPSGAVDVGSAVRWVRDNIGARGGDPARIFLMGHSAGAVHVASYAAFPEHHAPGGAGIAGVILVSGLYDFARRAPGKPEQAYFGDRASSSEVSSLPGLVKSQLPILLVWASLDPGNFIQQGSLLNDALCAANRCPKPVVLEGHSHMSEVYAIGTGDRTLEDAIVRFAGGRN
jgi:acetyl esterase/lipase